ncbi:MAG: Peptidyl-prolyl cis-trans isomerase [Aureobasidium pullulans]|nr:MAG: DEAD-domain-containing protein [Aureobasidium pullulans]OBW69629.1 MAG: Peptidyl-prolyl cis-trans isomerase [Aureobasidium pullulans]
MLQLPNELLFRIADFTCKADLPSLRATCKHLEQLTRKRFAAAYITAARSPASFAGLDQLDRIVSRSHSSAVIQGWMAVGDVPVHLGFEGFETPLREIFQKMTQHACGLDIGIVLPTGSEQSHYCGDDLGKHNRTMNFGIMMLGALPNLSHVRSFSIDARHSSENGSMLVLDLRRVVQGVLSSQAPAKELHVIDCTISNAELRSLTKSVSNPGWHLDFEDILFRTHSDRLFRTHNDYRNLFVHHLQEALLHWSQGLHSCRLTNLRSYENGSKLIKDFEATGIDNIREIRELQPRLIIKFLIAQVNFPHAREIGPTTIAKWMKVMETASPPITEAGQSAYIAEHGENEDDPILEFAYRRGRGRPVREVKRRRNKKRNAARKKRAQKGARGEDEVEDEVEGEAGDDESELTGFSNNHGHINGYEEGGPLPTRDDCISLLDDAEQTVLEPSATTSPSLTSRMDKEETGE